MTSVRNQAVWIEISFAYYLPCPAPPLFPLTHLTINLTHSHARTNSLKLLKPVAIFY